MSDSNQPKAPLNIPSGNSQITPEPQPLKPDERLTGDKLQDLKSAFGRIQPKNDLENLGKMPCARNSLLYGIAAGTGIGAVRFLGSRRPWSAANWAVGSFLAITLFQWETCQSARRTELAQMKAIQDRYPHRHVSKLKKALGEDEAETRRPS